jgi:hypothetical protein
LIYERKRERAREERGRRKGEKGTNAAQGDYESHLLVFSTVY